jgi:hypothetical protein
MVQGPRKYCPGTSATATADLDWLKMLRSYPLIRHRSLYPNLLAIPLTLFLITTGGCTIDDIEPIVEDSRTSQQQRQTTAFPPKLEWVTDRDWKNFVLGLEVDSNDQKSKNYVQRILLHNYVQRILLHKR